MGGKKAMENTDSNLILVLFRNIFESTGSFNSSRDFALVILSGEKTLKLGV